jgi:general secretion pathway protein M
MKTTLKNYWLTLLPRERLLIAGGGGLLFIALLYAYFWLPIHQQQQRLHDLLPRVRVQAMQLQADRDEVLRLKAQVGAVTRTAMPLRQVLEQSAASLGIKPERIDMTGESSASVTMNKVVFDQYLRWLYLLQTQHGVRVSIGDVVAAGEVGLVNVQITVTQE